jgi:hypothetical protein
MLSALTVSAQDKQFVSLPTGPAPNFNPREAEGAFDILLYVDGEAFLYVKDTGLSYLPLSGAPIRNAGTNYSQGIPRAVFGSFNVVKKAGSGDVDLYEEPSPKNNYTAVIRVTDKKSGADFYHIHLDWTWNPADPSRPPGGRNSRPLDSRTNDPGDYRRGREGSFEFTGRVDDATVLHIRSDQVREEDLTGRPLRGDRFSFSQPLPAQRLKTLSLVDVQGRGEVDIVEKPWEGNNFTAVILINDPQRGNSEYSFRLVWSR